MQQDTAKRTSDVIKGCQIPPKITPKVLLRRCMLGKSRYACHGPDNSASKPCALTSLN